LTIQAEQFESRISALEKDKQTPQGFDNKSNFNNEINAMYPNATDKYSNNKRHINTNENDPNMNNDYLNTLHSNSNSKISYNNYSNEKQNKIKNNQNLDNNTNLENEND